MEDVDCHLIRVYTETGAHVKRPTLKLEKQSETLL
jgi:hypothetical protein